MKPNLTSVAALAAIMFSSSFVQAQSPSTPPAEPAAEQAVQGVPVTPAYPSSEQAFAPDIAAERLAKASEDLAQTVKESSAQSTQKLAEVAEALEKSAAALDAAAKALPQDPDREKILSSGVLSTGTRTAWNGLFLAFSEKEKKATMKVSAPIAYGRWLVTASATAPLDSKTRLAPLWDSRTSSGAFEAKLSLERNFASDQLQQWLKAWTDATGTKCDDFKAFWRTSYPGQRTPPCPGDTMNPQYQRWAAAQAARAAPARPGRVDDLFGKPVPNGLRWSVGAELGASFDKQKVYSDDLAKKAVEVTPRTLEALATARYYPRPWLAIPFKAGIRYVDEIKAKKTQRCVTRPSTDAQIAGKSCEDVLFLEEDPDGVPRARLEAALVFVPMLSLTALAGGLELRERVDLGKEGSVSVASAALFASPTDQPILTRFGVGLDWYYALSDDGGKTPAFEAGDSWLVPFLLVGGSL